MVRFGEGWGRMCWKVVLLFWIPLEIVYIHRLKVSSSFEHNLKKKCGMLLLVMVKLELMIYTLT